ncbi:MAG TPA: HIT domain-containing protein [Pyrinomonadaceae bacterium]|nr:HIT domain-containing protein [Pyrinomonadaceae bacterium]
MDRLWSPWRYEYISSGGGEDAGQQTCVFCSIQADTARDEANFVLYRGEHNYIVLNIYPYISGHLLVVPFEHVADLDTASKETTDELMDLIKRSQTVLREVYRPGGFNVGMNLGRSAGAGIVDHIHVHVMPRWTGDTNFISTIGETRVIPEDLTTTYRKLSDRFSRSD